MTILTNEDAPHFNEQDVRAFYRFLGHKKKGEFTEIRIIDPDKKEPPLQEFVQSEDKFVKLIKEWNGLRQCYAGLNPRKEKKGFAEDVSRVTTILFDVDSKHPKKKPATDTELEKAKKRVDELLVLIKDSGFQSPFISMSGNGFHIMQKVDIKIDEQTQKQLEHYHRKTADDLDPMFDLPRIVKIPGTLSIKGEPNKKRPHRLTYIIEKGSGLVDKKLSKHIRDIELDKVKEPAVEKTEGPEEVAIAPRKEPMLACLDWLIDNEVKGNRNNQNLLLVNDACLSGLTDAEIVDIFKRREKNEYKKTTTNYEIARMRKRHVEGKIRRATCKTLKEKYKLPCFDRCKRIQYSIRRKKSSLMKSILKEIGSKYIFKTPTDTEELFFYDSGVYIPAKAVVKAEIEKILGHDATVHQCNEIMDHFRRRSYTDRNEFNKTTDYLPLGNGLLNLATLSLEHHSPNNIFTYKIPTDYIPNAKCPKFTRGFNKIILEKDDRKLMQEYAGYTLLPSFPHHHLLFMTGEGRNGKGVIVRTIENILGEKNVSNIRLEDIWRRFSVATLYGRLMNVCSEPRTTKELETEVLKVVTGADSIDAEIKGIQKRLSFTNFAKFFVQANRLPTVADKSDAFWERVLIIKFTQQFTDRRGNRIPDIEDTWLKNENERSGILNWMLAGLKRVTKNGMFTESIAMRKIKVEFKQLSDPIGAFLSDESEVTYGSLLVVDRSVIYDAYKRYAEKLNANVRSMRAFNDRLRLMYNVVESKRKDGKTSIRTWKGIGLFDSDQPILETGSEKTGTRTEKSEPVSNNTEKGAQGAQGAPSTYTENKLKTKKVINNILSGDIDHATSAPSAPSEGPEIPRDSVSKPTIRSSKKLDEIVKDSKDKHPLVEFWYRYSDSLEKPVEVKKLTSEDHGMKLDFMSRGWIREEGSPQWIALTPAGREVILK